MRLDVFSGATDRISSLAASRSSCSSCAAFCFCPNGVEASNGLEVGIALRRRVAVRGVEVTAALNAAVCPGRVVPSNNAFKHSRLSRRGGGGVILRDPPAELLVVVLDSPYSSHYAPTIATMYSMSISVPELTNGPYGRQVARPFSVKAKRTPYRPADGASPSMTASD